jgi:hypothetical protein
MFKNSEASTIQELKVYLAALEGERERLRGLVASRGQSVLRRMQE